MFAANRFKSGSLSPDRLPGLAAWYSADYGVLSQVGGGTAFASASSQYLSVANNASFAGLTAISASCWIKPVAVGVDYAILDKSSGTTGRAFTINVRSTNVIQASIGADAGTTNFKEYRSAAVMTAGTWLHFAFTYSVADGFKIYVNGSVVASPTKAFDGAVTSIANGTNLFVGSNNGGASGFVNGTVDEATIHSRVLSAAEITWLYNSGAGRTYSEADASLKTNLVSWWSMNAPASGDWQDQHGTNNLTPSASRPTATEGVTFNAATDGQTVRRWLDRSGNANYSDQSNLLYQPTLSGSALAFTTSWLNMLNTSVFRNKTYGHIFVVCQDTNLGGGATQHAALSVSISGGASARAAIYSKVSSPSNSFMGIARRLDADSAVVSTTASNANANILELHCRWGAGAMEFVKNGVSDIQSFAASGATADSASLFAAIGATGAGLGFEYYFTGLIKEIIITNQPLTDAQIVGTRKYLNRRHSVY